MNDSIVTDDIGVEEIGYNVSLIMSTCALLFFLGMNVNTDHGALPSAATSIKEDLKLTNANFGTLGSMVFLGIVSGSLTAPMVFSRASYKFILFVAFIVNGVGLLGFIMTNNFLLICLSRLISGFSQIFLTIYIPIYVDCFSTKKAKPFLMSMILLASPLGVTVGYGWGGYVVGSGHSWRFAFFGLAIVSGASSILIFLLPDKYLNIDECHRKKQALKESRNS